MKILHPSSKWLLQSGFVLLTMRRKKEKRNFWLNSEIGCMLNLVRQMHVKQGTTTTTHFTFVEIANQMSAYGFPNKSPTQIRRKWFQMKSAYLCYKRGNKDRILLIPEKFRQVIAGFVDAEYNGDKKSPIPEVPDVEPLPPPLPVKKVTPPPVKKVTPTQTKKITQPPLPTVVRIEAKTPAPPKPVERKIKSPDLPKVDKQKRKRKLDLDIECDKEPANTDQKFAKLTNRLKSIQKSLLKDFLERQKTLMEYEHELQQERDRNLMDYFKKSTEQILSDSFGIMRQMATGN